MSGLSPEARALFAAARESYTPNAARLAKVSALVLSQTGTAMAATGMASATKAAAGKAGATSVFGSLSAVKIAGAVAVVVAGAGVATFVRPDAPAVPAASAPAAPKAQPGGRTAEPEAVATGASDVPAASAPVAPKAQPGVRTAEPEAVAAGTSDARVATPEEPALDSPEAPSRARPAPSTKRQGSAAVRAPDKDLPSERVVLEETPEPARADVPAPPPDVLAKEVLLLQAARRALSSGDPSRALALAREYAELHPRGTLQQEMQVVRALALCNSGRTAEGRRLAEAILRASPRSPHAERLRKACGAPP